MTTEDLTVKLPPKLKIGTKTALSILIGIGAIGVTAFWQYSDKHNSDLFLSKDEYVKDQSQREKDQQRILLEIGKVDKRQEEMQRDIKELLKK